MSKKSKFKELVEDCKFKGREGFKCVNQDNEKYCLVGSCAVEFCPVLNSKPNLPEEEKQEGSDSEAQEENVPAAEDVPAVDEEISEEEEETVQEKDSVGREKTPVETRIDIKKGL